MRSPLDAIFCSDAWVGSIGIVVFLFHEASSFLGIHIPRLPSKGARFFFLKRKTDARFTRVYRVVRSL